VPAAASRTSSPSAALPTNGLNVLVAIVLHAFMPFDPVLANHTVICEDSSDGVVHQLICWTIAIDLGADKLRYEQREDRIVFEGPEGAIVFNWDKAVTISGAALSLREAR
jgi:hypothetical protein